MHAPVLADARHRFDLARVRPIAKVASAQINLLSGLQAAHLAAEQPAAPVQPAVQPPGEAVQPRLKIMPRKARHIRPHDVGAPITIGILGVEQVRRGADERAFAPWHHAGRERNAVEEQRRLVVASVAIAVGENLDATTRREAARRLPDRLAILAPDLDRRFETAWVVIHLAHPQPPLRVPINGDRRFNQRFACDEFHDHLRLGADGAQGFLRRLRGRQIGALGIAMK